MKRNLVQRLGAATVGAMLIGTALTAWSTSNSRNTPARSLATAGAAALAHRDTAKPTGSPIKLALVNVASGYEASLNVEVAPTGKAWTSWVNATGGINGHPVELEILDTKSNPSTSVAEVTQAMSDGTVAFVSADPGDEVTFAPYIAKKNIPVVGAFGYDTPPWGTYPDFFTTFADSPNIVQGHVAAAKAVGAKKMSVVVCSEYAVCSGIDAVLKPLAKASGVQYLGLVKVASDAPNYTAPCLEMISTGTDYIDVSTEADVAQRVITECVKQGYKGWFGVNGATVQASSFATFKNVKIAGYLNGFPWWVHAAPVKQFLSVMKTYAAGFNYYGDPGSTSVWAALQVLAQALRKGTTASRPVTAANVFTGLYALKGDTLDGLLSQPINFTAGQPSPHFSCGWVYRYENGNFTSIPGGLKPTCLTGSSY
jgi:branched-chain amino acid transport system substrate-binding protein